MRKGWFKKAKKKFVKKRVYRWKLCFSTGIEEIEYLRSGKSTIQFYSHDRVCQLLEKVRDLGFVKGFWYARKEGKKREFYFWFDKKI